MNDNERNMIRYVCRNDLKMAQTYAKIVLANITSQKDLRFKENLLAQLAEAENKGLEIPMNLKGILESYNTSKFPHERFLLRESEKEAVDRIIKTYKAAEKLMELEIPFVPALMLYGESGCGKTMLAQYIAYKVGLPFLYVRFSNLIRSYLGETQGNIARVFQFVRQIPCVLCFDEIDAIGMSRGKGNDVGEMSRVVIALMQELDDIPNNIIVIGTTNRFDILDKALIRRFPIQHEVKRLSGFDTWSLAKQFLSFANCYEKNDPQVRKWFDSTFPSYEKSKSDSGTVKNCTYPASTIIKECTDYIVDKIMSEIQEESTE